MCPSVCKSASLQGVGVYYNWSWKKRRDYNRHSVAKKNKNARSETKNATTQSKEMEMEDARSELHWGESVCKACAPLRAGKQRYSLPCTCLLQRPRNDVPLWPVCSSSGVKHNEVFVRECVCVYTFVYVCPALTELELFQGLKVWKPVGSPLHHAVKQKTED